ncbi:MAG: DUF362 domain-containing protein, partial [Candidatus Thorarchaeota archaeon]
YFVRRVVDAIKKTGAYPFVTDNPTAVYQAAVRGYTAETVGCPIIPIAGVKDRYTVRERIGFMNVDELELAGVLHDSDALVVITHGKGHGNCGFGGSIKNIALGGYSGPSRWNKIHGVVFEHELYDRSKMTREHAESLIASCPVKALRWDEKKGRLLLEPYTCDQCHEDEKSCVRADGGKTGWRVIPDVFDSFQEMMALSAKAVLDNFDSDKRFFFNFLFDITPFCDCMGMGMPNVVPDIGLLASRDIVAVDTASLDMIAKTGLEEKTVGMIPDSYMRINRHPSPGLHPFQVLHGPMKNPYRVIDFAVKHGLGNREYELVELLPLSEVQKMDPGGWAPERGPTFF